MAPPPETTGLAHFFPNEINGRKWVAAISAIPLLLAGLGAAHRSTVAPMDKTSPAQGQVLSIPNPVPPKADRLSAVEPPAAPPVAPLAQFPGWAGVIEGLQAPKPSQPPPVTQEPPLPKSHTAAARRMPLCNQHHLRTVWSTKYQWRCRR